MIDFIEGEVKFKYPDGIGVSCGGMGIKILIPTQFLAKVKPGAKVFLFIKLLLPQEGSPTVYGFEKEEDRKLFELLIKTPKVGSRTALNILSHFNKKELEQIVSSKDIKTLSTVPGLGKKLSERLIFELSRKLKTEETGKNFEILEILENLGYQRKEIINALNKLETENLPLEKIVKKLTGILSGGKFGR